MFIISIVKPIESLHEKFLTWALNRKAESVATSQPIVLRWYLKKVFGRIQEDESSEFSIGFSVTSGYFFIYEDEAELTPRLPDDNMFSFENQDDEDDVLSRGIIDENNVIFVKDRGEIDYETDESVLILYAPKQIAGVSDAEYKRLINQCLDRYIINKMDYQIVITD